MAPPRKSSPTATARRKSSTTTATAMRASLIVKLPLPPTWLSRFPPSKNDDDAARSTSIVPSSQQDITDQKTDTRMDNMGTPDAAAMPPPKKGVKRNADDVTKVRGKPGPKKRPRREDGTIDHTQPRPNGVSKGISNPRHNTGAINAGLRALDRSGKPCRKWARGGFRVKSFTGVVWEVPSWRAPLQAHDLKGDSTEGSQSNDSSTKENKDGSQAMSDKSNDTPARDGDKASALSQKLDSPSPMVAVVAC